MPHQAAGTTIFVCVGVFTDASTVSAHRKTKIMAWNRALSSAERELYREAPLNVQQTIIGNPDPAGGLLGLRDLRLVSITQRRYLKHYMSTLVGKPFFLAWRVSPSWMGPHSLWRLADYSKASWQTAAAGLLRTSMSAAQVEYYHWAIYCTTSPSVQRLKGNLSWSQHFQPLIRLITCDDNQ